LRGETVRADRGFFAIAFDIGDRPRDSLAVSGERRSDALRQQRAADRVRTAGNENRAAPLAGLRRDPADRICCRGVEERHAPTSITSTLWLSAMPSSTEPIVDAAPKKNCGTPQGRDRSDHVAAPNAWVSGIVIGAVAIAALTKFAEWEEWINLLLGVWFWLRLGC
jgi:hypothetical protein